MDLEMPQWHDTDKARDYFMAHSDKNVWENAKQFVAMCSYSPVNGTMESDRTVSFHDAAAIARALFTEREMHNAWRKRAEEAEAKITKADYLLTQGAPTLALEALQ